MMEKNFLLENGFSIPQIGYGTFKATDGTDESVIMKALEAGYRHLDTAKIYGNEAFVGKAIEQGGVPRSELFLTSKIWKTDLGYEGAMSSVEQSLKDLDTHYLDLLLIHWPKTDSADDGWMKRNAETWRALERLYDQGVVTAIGVSNFLPHHLMPLLANANIKPMVNQLEYHPGYTQQVAVNYCQANGILVEAWSPLGRARLMEDPLLLELSKKYGKSVAQICIRFALQNNVLPLPKASSLQRMQENLDVYNFDIELEDMYRLLTMPQTGWSGLHPDTF